LTTAYIGLAAMLADLQALIFCNAISNRSGQDFHSSAFVHIFIFSFPIVLTLWAERYKIPAQQQALILAQA